MPLKERQCSPHSPGDKPLDLRRIAALKAQLITGWEVVDARKLSKSFEFESYRRALAFVQEIGILADRQDHHPDVCIRYTSVEVELSTHDIGGLSENDFIMAAKIEDL